MEDIKEKKTKRDKKELLKYSPIDIFIERFSFNKNADLELFYHTLTNEKSWFIEKLRNNSSSFAKAKKNLLKLENSLLAKNERNAKRIFEAVQDIKLEYFEFNKNLTDSHHFMTTLLKIIVAYKTAPNEMYKELEKLPSNFSELVQKIEFTNEEKININIFNRVRNIIVHAPTTVVIQHLTESVLTQFWFVVNNMVEIISNLINNNGEAIKTVFEQRAEDKDAFFKLEPLKEFAKVCGLEANEVLEIVKNSSFDYNRSINIEMNLDIYMKRAIMEDIKALIAIKKETAEQKAIESNIKYIKNMEAIFIVDFDYLLNDNNKDIDKTFNEICELQDKLKARELWIYSDSTKNETKKAIEQLFFTVNKKDDSLHFTDCNLVIEKIKKISTNKLVIAYGNQKIVECLKDLKLDVHFICTNANKIKENVNKITISKGKEVKIRHFIQKEDIE